MYWPDTNTGVDIEPARKPVASAVRKFFTEGGAGQPPTVPGGDWFNQITNELLNVLAAAGIDPSKMDDDQLLLAIQQLSNAAAGGEALYRSFALAGYKIEPGSFEQGGWLYSSTSALIHKQTGKVFVGSGPFPQQVFPDTSPFSEDFSDVSDVFSYSSPETFIGDATPISSAIVSALQSAKTTKFHRIYSLVSPVRVPTRKTLKGDGELTGLEWVGGSGPEGANISVLEVKSANPSGSALVNVTIKDFSIDINGSDNITAVDMQYASVQSMIDGVRVSDLGDNSIAFSLSKEWYARLARCSVRSSERKGTGVLAATSLGQINAVPLDVQVNGADIGFDIDTSSNYIYSLSLPPTSHAENCNIGLKVRSGQGVRSGVISTYFENNGIDVEWGDPGSTPSDVTQTIVWQGATFNPVGSRVVLYEGRHYFIGCDRIDTLEVHGSASAEVIGSIINNRVNTTGDKHRLRYKPTPATWMSDSKYGNAFLLSGREHNQEIITSLNAVTFNFVSELFGNAPANGRTARLMVTSRRNNENVTRWFDLLLVQSSAGQWAITQISGSAEPSSTVSVDASNGLLTLGDTRTGTKVYNLVAHPF